MREPRLFESPGPDLRRPAGGHRHTAAPSRGSGRRPRSTARPSSRPTTGAQRSPSRAQRGSVRRSAPDRLWEKPPAAPATNRCGRRFLPSAFWQIRAPQTQCPGRGSAPEARPRASRRRLIAHWGTVFAKKRHHHELCGAFYRRFGVRGIVLLAMPTSADIARILRKAPDSAAGPDGIPYAAWRAAGQRGHSILFNMFVHLLQGHAPLRSYIASILVCLPKGSRTSDATGAVRTASKTRPLGLKKCDAKTVAALLARPLATADGPLRMCWSSTLSPEP